MRIRANLNVSRRGIYVGATIAIGALVWAGFIYEAPPERQVLIESARFYTSLGLFDEARESVLVALEQDEQDLEATLLLAFLNEVLGRPSFALSAYERAIDRIDDPDERFATLAAMAANCLKSGRPRRALNLAESIQEEYGDGVISRVIKALSHYSLRDDSAFLEELSKAYHMAPNQDVFRRPATSLLRPGLAAWRYGHTAQTRSLVGL